MIKPASPSDILHPRQCATVLKALADGTRLHILESLLVEEKCVTELVRVLHCPQPHISHHIRIISAFFEIPEWLRGFGKVSRSPIGSRRLSSGRWPTAKGRH